MIGITAAILLFGWRWKWFQL